MSRQQLVTFILAFAVGAIVALAVRSARHDPYAAPTPASVMEAPAASEPVDPHAGHAQGDPETAAGPAPVNTVCAICGMAVDPKLPTAVYRGKVVGFGCKTCPAEFAANPHAYGPAALENRVVEE